MKRLSHLIVVILLTLLSTASAVESEYHKFTDSQGREIEAKILRMQGTRVEIQRKDGQVFIVSPDIFSITDQKFITKWQQDSVLKSGDVTEIKAKSSHTRKQEEDTGAIVYDHYEGFYDIAVENKTDLDLKNLEAKYRYFVFHNDIAAHKRSQGKLNRVEGEHKIASLPGRTKYEFETSKTKMKDSKLKSGWYYGNGGKDKSEDEFEGVWVRIYNGKDVIGEFAYPSNLPSKEDW